MPRGGLRIAGVSKQPQKPIMVPKNDDTPANFDALLDDAVRKTRKVLQKPIEATGDAAIIRACVDLFLFWKAKKSTEMNINVKKETISLDFHEVLMKLAGRDGIPGAAIPAEFSELQLLAATPDPAAGTKNADRQPANTTPSPGADRVPGAVHQSPT